MFMAVYSRPREGEDALQASVTYSGGLYVSLSLAEREHERLSQFHLIWSTG